MTPAEAIEHLIRDSMEIGYRAAEMGVSLSVAQQEALASPVAAEMIRRNIAAVRQVGA